MPIEFRCPSCNALLRVPDDSAGRQAKCPKCDSLTAVPTTPTPPVTPPSSGSPFGGGNIATPTAPADTQNPYQSPADYVSSWDAVQPCMPATEIRPTRIDVGDIFRRTWEIFKRQWAMCLAGVFLGWVLYMVGCVLLYTPIVIGLGLGFEDEPAAFIPLVFLGYALLLAYIPWLIGGVIRFFLGIARGQQPSIAELVRGGPSWWPLIGATLLMWLISVGITLACILPALVLLAVSQEAFQVAYFAGILLANALNLVVFFMFSQAFFLIVDRRMGVIDAFSRSKEITHGNKFWLFVLWLAACVLTVVSAIPCGLGLLFTMPFFALMVPVVHLVMTGQTTADRSYCSYLPTPIHAG